MRTESKLFLETYLNNASPTGFESKGQKIWMDYLRPYVDKFITDIYGSVVGVINPDAPYKVAIEAHADEIAYFVNYINDKGYIYLKRNGGSDPLIAPSKRVNIHTENGIVKAVFGWPAIHVRTREKEDAPTLKTIFLDCGCDNKEEVEKLGVHVGCVVTFEDELMWLNHEKYITGRALDNRIGGFMIAEVARMIKENNHNLPFGLYIINSVQEEIGLRGAEMISRRIKPNLAIITDVCHDTQSPMYDKEMIGDISCGKGPVLTYGPAVQNNLLRHIIRVAQEKEIPFQRTTADRSTGTDTDSFAYSAEGVAAALISLPLKYMHTTVESVKTEDVENVIQLMYEFIIQLKGNENYSYFDNMELN